MPCKYYDDIDYRYISYDVENTVKLEKNDFKKFKMN